MFYWVAGGIALFGLIALLMSSFPGAVSEREDWAQIIRTVGILALVSSALLHMRMRASHVLRNMAAWLAIGVVVFIGFSFRQEIGMVKDRMLGELNPAGGVAGQSGEMYFRAGADGHFHIQALVNGTPVRFMVDTGASQVVLAPADAVRAGIPLQSLEFVGRARTANGTVATAPVRLNSIEVGPIRVDNVAASVNGADMGQSLLGMSFLNRLTTYRVENGTLILSQ